ncbi:MAG: TonB-dependent receptor, partial [Deltaproteobacteria bacterium]|nr:TonB-dependent receptor [Deltaproteobacteria bacterium]
MIGAARLVSALLAASLLGSVGTARAQEGRDSEAERDEPRAPVLEPPSLERTVEAAYPEEALRLGLEGDVLLELVVSSEGLVTDVRVVTGAGHGFDEAAIEAARRFELAPARRDGEPVAARIRYLYRFRRPAPVDDTDEGAADSDARRLPEDSARSDAEAARPRAGAAAAAGPSGARAEPEIVFETVSRAAAPSRDPGRRELVREDLDRIPGTRGDALLALQSMPGVARPPFGLGVFLVRGAAPQDTLVALEGHPYGLPFHFGGFASTIATDLVDRITFVPGNFSARFGRVTGGVVDVRLRAPDSRRPHLSFDIDPIDLGLYASVPIGERTVAAAGLRRSFVDLVVPPFLPDDLGVRLTQFPVYWDYQAIVEHRPSSRSAVRVLASGYDDQLTLAFDDIGEDDPALRGAFRTHLAHHGLQLQWRTAVGARTTHTFSTSVAYDQSAGGLGQSIHFDFRSWTTSVRDEMVFRPTRRLRLYAGVDVVSGVLDNTVVAPPLPEPGAPVDPVAASDLSRYDDVRTFVNPAAYIEADWTPSPRVRATAGLRLDSWSLIRRATLDPRFSLRVNLHRRLALEGAVGLYSASPRGPEITPGFGNPDLGVERALHTSLGFVEQLGAGFELDARVFYKDLFGLAARTDARIVRDGVEEPLRYSNDGAGRVIGGEWLLRVRPAPLPLFGWIAYTLSRSLRRDAPSEPYRLYGYDQTHILTFVLGVLLPAGFDAGVRARYVTGLIEPRVTGGVLDADTGTYVFLYDRDHPTRLGDTFSLDLRVAKRFRWGPLRMTAVLEVLNVTNHRNPERRIY